MNRFFDADCKRFEIATRKSAVGVQTFVHNDEVAKFLEHSPVVDCKPAADVDKIILLGAHPCGIGVTAKFKENFCDGFICVAFFALLNEIGIFHHAGGIEINLDAVFVAQSAQGFDICHADGLSACHVDRARHADVGDVIRANFIDQRLNFIQINVALERMQIGGIVRLVNDDIQ